MKKGFLRKRLALLLAVSMLMPTPVFAEEVPAGDEETVLSYEINNDGEGPVPENGGEPVDIDSESDPEQEPEYYEDKSDVQDESIIENHSDPENDLDQTDADGTDSDNSAESTVFGSDEEESPSENSVSLDFTEFTKEELEEHIMNYRDVEGDDEVESTSVFAKGRRLLRTAGNDLPARYDNNDFSGYMPALRDQDPFGSCWAHSALALAEISLRKKGIMADPNLSELQLAYFYYNSVVDPLGGTKGDKNKGTFAGSNYLDYGGSLDFAKNVLASWTGAADDDGDLVYPKTKSARPETLDDAYAYDDIAHLVNYYNVNIKENPADAKKLICEYGAIGISFYAPSSTSSAVTEAYYNKTSNAFYDPTDYGKTNHAVTVVGWDDNFSKDNFTIKPQNDGAWLVRNSWTTGTFEENQSYSGYFWMSYDTPSIKNNAYAFDFDTSYNYDHNYQYDGAMNSEGIYKFGTAEAANVFTVSGGKYGEDLKAVAFQTDTTNVDYTVDIYTGLSADDINPLSRNKVATKSGTNTYAGYYTVKLDTPVSLGYGERYAVVVTLKKNGQLVSIGAESSFQTQDYVISAYSKPGQSFELNGGNWQDYGKNEHGNFRIKAFTDDRSASELVDLAAETTVISVNRTTYTGTARKPKVTVTYDNGQVLNASSYDLEYSDNVGAGTGSVTVTAKDGNGVCTGSKTAAFTILPAKLENATWYYISEPNGILKQNICGRFSSVYPIAEIAQHYVLKYNGSILTDGEDYHVVSGNGHCFLDATDEGSGEYSSFYLNGQGNFTGRKELVAKIDPTDISKEGYVYHAKFNEGEVYYLGATASISPQTYTGEPLEPELNLENRTRGSLSRNSDYTVSFSNNVNVGTATAVVTGINNYKNTTSFTFSIDPADISESDLFGVYDMEYTGGEITLPELAVSCNGKPLTPGTDYDVSYTNNNDIGTASVVITGRGNFTGIKTAGFRILESGYTLSEGNVTLSPDSFIYDGHAKIPNVTVSHDGNTLTRNTHYSLNIADNINAGTGRVTVIGRGVYKGTVEKNFTISQASISASTVTIGSYSNEYCGSAIEPPFTVDLSGNRLSSQDYDFEYSDNTGEGTGKIIITGKGNYEGRVVKEFSIVSKKYSVTLNPRGGVCSKNSISVSHDGLYLGLPDVISKNGYSFLGWYTAENGGDFVSSNMIIKQNADHTLYAHWKVDSYALSFNCCVGLPYKNYISTNDIVSPNGFTVTYGSTYGSLPQLSCEGYLFSGWYTAATGGSKVNETDTVLILKESTLFAHWEPKEFKVTLEPEGGICDTGEIRVLYGRKYAGLPDNVTREGYYFGGWYTDRVAGTHPVSGNYSASGKFIHEISADSVMRKASDHSLYAYWKPNTYTVSFNCHGGVSCNSITVSYDQLYGTLPTPKRPGYGFLGWFLEDGTTRIKSTDTVGITADTILHAHWEAGRYDITLNALSGNVTPASIRVTNGGTYSDLPDAERAGYDFIGWYDNRELSGNAITRTSIVELSGNSVLYAKYKAKEFAVDLDSRGGSCSVNSITVSYDGQYDGLPETVSRDGYTFTGWYTATEGGDYVSSNRVVKILSNTTLYAHWTANSYTVSFNCRAGLPSYNGVSINTFVSPNEITVIYDRPYGILPQPSCEGYLFSGWFTSAAGGTKVTETDIVSISTDSVLFAHWEPRSYKVTLEPNGGDCNIREITVRYREKYAGLPEYITRRGYSFKGWFIDGDAVTHPISGNNSVSSCDNFAISADSVVWVASDHTLYARWKPNIYTLSFNSCGGSAVRSKTVSYDQVYGDLPIPENEGYGFTGWYTSAEGGTRITKDDMVQITADTVLYAHWRPGEFTVTLDAGRGTVDPTAVTVRYGETYQGLPSAVRNGYNFTGWYTESANRVNYTDTVKLKGDITLYAGYSAKYYTVTLNPNGGTCSRNSISVSFDSPYSDLPNTASKNGYSFAGWFTGMSGGVSVNSADMMTTEENHTLYARWIPNNYTVSFDSKTGSAVAEKSVIFGSKYGSLETPTRIGYRFDGWFDAENGGLRITKDSIVSKASDHTLYAKWTANSYKVIFNSKGGSAVNTRNVIYNSQYGVLPEPNREGYMFDGWYDAETGGNRILPETIVNTASVHTLFAYWRPNKYTISFNANGGSCETADRIVSYDQIYETLPDASRTGYDFKGWYTALTGGIKINPSDAVKFTKDVWLYAHWTAKTYRVNLSPNGGSVNPAYIVVTYDGKYSNLPTPMKKGHRFDGWFTEESGGEPVSRNTRVVITSDQTLYAHWTPETYRITLNTNGGNAFAPSSFTVTYGQTYAGLPVEIPTKIGYGFEGWYTSPTGGSKVTALTPVTITDGQTLYAHWTPNTYTVNLHPVSGNCDKASILVTYDDSYSALPKAELEDYIFVGWFTANGSKVRKTDTVKILADVDLYAHYVLTDAISVKLDKESIAIKTGETAKLTAKIEPDEASELPLIWKSSDEKIVTVDDSGEVTGVTSGTAKITVTVDDTGKSAECTVNYIGNEEQFRNSSGETVTLIKDPEYNTYKTSAGQEVLVLSKENGASAEVASYQYTSKKIKPGKDSLIVYNGMVYKYGVDYTIKFKKNKKTGTAQAIIKWKKGSVPYAEGVKKIKQTFNVVPRVVSENMVQISVKNTMNGPIIKKVAVTADGITMKVSKKDFSYSYSEDGFTITFRRNFKGEVKKKI